MEESPTVFIVDDDAAVRSSVELLLKSAGLRYRSFESGEAFLLGYDPSCPGCMILDVSMPGMSGLQLQQILIERRIRIPIIFITGHGDVPMSVTAVKAGAVDFLQKPFDQATLLARVREAIDWDLNFRREEAEKIADAVRFYADSMVKTVPEPLLVLDTDLRILAANPSFYETFNTDAEQTYRQPLLEYNQGEWRIAALVDGLQRLVTNGVELWNMEVSHEFRRLGLRVMRLNARELQQPRSSSRRFLLAIEDITERKHAEQALQKSERRLAEAQRIAHVGNWNWDIKSGALHWSDEVYRIFGFEPQQFTATYEGFLNALHGEDRSMVVDAIDRALFHTAAYDMDHRIVRPDGAVRIVHEFGQVVYDDQGGPAQMNGIVQDITDSKQAEQKLRESEERFRLMAETITDVFWIRTPDFDKTLYISPACEDIWGCSRKSLFAAPWSWIERVHPEDKPRLLAGITAHARGEWDFEYRIVHDDRGIRWIRDRGFAVRDDHQQLRYMTGVATDITERRTAEDQLRQAAIVFENTNEGIIITDANHHIVAVNKAFTDITGYKFDEVKHKNPDFMHPGERSHLEDSSSERLAVLQKQGNWRGETWKRRKNGEVYPEWENISTVKDETGQITHYISVFSDISPIKKTEQRLNYLAHHDALTDLPNRLLFSANLNQAMERARRHRQRVALLYLDLDGFKTINDTLGHGIGDALLQSVAKRIKACVRAEDTVARLGGDEFTVVLAEVNFRNDVAMMAKKILREITRPINIGDHDISTTASVGIALFPDDGEKADELLEAADQAMYSIKNRNRNNFRFYKSGTFPAKLNRRDKQKTVNETTN